MRRAGLLSNKDQGGTTVQAVTDTTDTDTAQKETVTQATRFDLNAAVSEEGSNFSAGERQLLALCRALVKESKVIIMVCVPLNWRRIKLTVPP